MFVLKRRQLVDIDEHPNSSIRHIGVSLTTTEAQEMIKKDYRVFANEDGPFLVVRVPTGWASVLSTIDKNSATITINPLPWKVSGSSGIICWVTKIV